MNEHICLLHLSLLVNECKTQQGFQINSDLPACGGVKFRNHQLEVFSHPGDDTDARQDAFIGTDH